MKINNFTFSFFYINRVVVSLSVNLKTSKLRVWTFERKEDLIFYHNMSTPESRYEYPIDSGKVARKSKPFPAES